METLKSGSFGHLFAVTFFVAATFQVAASLLALVFAVLAPSGFTLNNRPAANPGEAIVVVIMLLIAALVMNAMISAGGSGLWLLARRPFVKKPTPAEVF